MITKLLGFFWSEGNFNIPGLTRSSTCVHQLPLLYLLNRDCIFSTKWSRASLSTVVPTWHVTFDIHWGALYVFKTIVIIRVIGILIITGAPPASGISPFEATSSTDTGAVICGTLLGVLALVVLVTALLGCLIYYKRRKGRKLNRRYQCLWPHLLWHFMSCTQRPTVFCCCFFSITAPQVERKRWLECRW